MVFEMLIDHHVHLGVDLNKTNFSLTLEELLKKMLALGIDKSVVFSCPNITPRLVNPYAIENEQIYLAFLQEPDKVIPFMFVHPFRDSLDYLNENQARFKGFKVYSHARGMEYSYADLLSSPQLKFLASTGKPMLFHTSKISGGRIGEAMSFIRGVTNPLAFAHSGRLFHKDLVAAARYSHVFIDIAPLATNLTKPDLFMAPEQERQQGLTLNHSSVISYLNSLFSERVIWGSDTPWSDRIISQGYAAEVEVLKELRTQGLSNNGFL